MIYLYHVLTFLLFPLYLLLLIWRIYKKKENIYRVAERFGVASREKPPGFLIWIHAASVGESGVAFTLLEGFNAICPGCNFLITSGTNSSAKIIAQKLPINSVHQFLPIDNLVVVKKFLNHWQPNLAVFIEAELWPCLIYESSKICKLLLFNASISDRSFRRWRIISLFLQQILACFNEVITKSILDLEKFKSLGVEKIKNLGNIKFSNKKLFVDELESLKLSDHLKNKQVIVFASTHKEDEEVILKIINLIKKEYKDSYFIVVLRHPERRTEIIKTCNQLKLKFKIRSQTHIPDLEDDLYIVDKFGELGLFYNLAYISFIGGSFKQGGHNPLEAIYFNNLIMFGPNMNKCQDIAKSMIEKKAAIQIHNSEELQKNLLYFLSNVGRKEAHFYQANAFTLLKEHQQILADYLKIAKKYIKK